MIQQLLHSVIALVLVVIFRTLSFPLLPFKLAR